MCQPLHVTSITSIKGALERCTQVLTLATHRAQQGKQYYETDRDTGSQAMLVCLDCSHSSRSLLARNTLQLRSNWRIH